MPEGTVDPIWFDRTYYLVPGAPPAQRRPYALLVQAMTATGMAGLGRFVRAGKEYRCLVRSSGDALVLETLFLAADVNSQAEIAEAMEATEVVETELDLARQIISGLEGAFDPAELQSDYRRDLRALLDAKQRGEVLVVTEAPEPEAPVVDLLDALRASVAAAKASGAGKTAAAKPAKRKAPARTRNAR